jgi:hypothetical protein
MYGKRLVVVLWEYFVSMHHCVLQRATDEELALIREHLSTKPEVPLDKPEQFLHELAEIPNFADRISCFMFQSEFDDGISSIESKLNNLKSTCQVTISLFTDSLAVEPKRSAQAMNGAGVLQI